MGTVLGRILDVFQTTRRAKIIGIGRELIAIRKDGNEFPIELSVGEVRDGDEVFFTGILRDITERKRAGALGAGQLSQRCGEIEALVRNTGAEQARPLVASLEFELTAAIDGLDSALGEMRVPA